MGLAVDDHYDELLKVRGVMIVNLADTAEAVALAPGLSQVQARRMIDGMRPLLEAFEASVTAAHTSSSVHYSLGDLPVDQSKAYARTKHAITLLDRLYPAAFDG